MKPLRAIMLAAAFLPAHVPTAAAQQSATALPADVVDAWTNAGARFGWMGVSRYGAPVFRDSFGGTGKTGELPGFRFLVWKGVGGLPQPPRPFGLYVHGSNLS